MISVTSGTLFIIASISIIIGFVAGGIIGLTNGRKRKKKEEEIAGENETQQLSPPLVDPAKYTELVRLWREKEGNSLFVETSGHLLATSEPLNDRQRKRFIDLLKELADWLNIPTAEISEKLAPQKVQEQGIQTPPVSGPDKSNTPMSSVPPVPDSTAGSAIKTMPVPPPASIPINEEAGPIPVPIPVPVPVQHQPPAPKPAQKPGAESTKKPALTMVEQIDEILQEVIDNSEKPDKKIRLIEEPNEGVAVWVGSEHYIGIDAVPDPIVKDLIRLAVKEWDKRTEKRG
jgi:hypothetical protein